MVLAVVLAAGGAVAQAPAPAADPVVAKINGVEIRQSDLALAEEDVGQNVPAGTADAKRDWLINYLTDMTLLAKAAEAQKVQDSDDFKKRLAYVRSKALMETLLRDSGKAGATSEAMQHVYQEAVKQMGDEQEVHARHILFRVADASDQKAAAAAEAKAKDTLARIKKGEDFAKLAKDLTEDPPGKADGGDLGWFTKDQMVPEFSEAAFKLDKGQVSDPVKTSFGWHIIKVEDKRKREAPPFDQVKDQIETFVTRKAQIELLNKLRQEAKIERLDKPADAKPAADKPADTKAPAPEKK
ncbi:peptidylprolyl isomerase [Rhodoplanes serenus]|uniref:Parvulin-like PPIase n=1 Tax=Rhodoplanes serenus TaxID=200615 RepID=A0A447CX74_9BRAD|nr:putative parvulin-type peptidyl-prolyl cis-trans isomerase [Rhodoplanes serenus]